MLGAGSLQKWTEFQEVKGSQQRKLFAWADSQTSPSETGGFEFWGFNSLIFRLSSLVSRLFLRTFSLDLSSDRRSAAFLLRSVSTSALAGRIPLDSFISHTQTSTLNYATRPRPFPRRALRMVSSDKTSLLVCQSGPTLRGEPAEVEI